MQCEEVRKQFAEYLTGTLTPPAEGAVLEHLGICVSCRREFEELGNIWGGLAEIPVPAIDPSATRQTIEAAMATLKLETYQNRRYDMRQAIRAILVIIVAVTLAAGAGLLLNREREAVPSGASSVRGLASAPVTLVEYGDYECPPCVVSHGVVKELLEKYPERVKYEFRHFPLTKIHANALRAAVAAEAAADQGKFWEMHDLLFESQAAWARKEGAENRFIEMAKQLGMDSARFTASMQLPEAELRVLKAAEAAGEAGIEGTPTFFINGKRVEGSPRTVQEFLDLMPAR